MYKDKDKQREANRRAKQKQRAKLGMTSEGMTEIDTPLDVIPRLRADDVVERRGKDITKFEHLPQDVQGTINRLSSGDQEHARRTAIAINYQHQFPDKFRCTGIGQAVASDPQPIRVSKPGDADYKPLCATTRLWVHQWVRGRI